MDNYHGFCKNVTWLLYCNANRSNCYKVSLKLCNKSQNLQWHLWQWQYWNESCRHFSYLLIAASMRVMIPPYGQYSGTVAGGHSGGREVKWRHAAANCKWQPVRALNPARRTKPCDTAGTEATLAPRNTKGLGSVQPCEIQAVWNERRAVAVRTERRRCCSATVSLPGLWSRPRAPQLSQNGIFLSSERGQKNVQLKKPGPCRHKCKRRRAHVHAQPCSQSQTLPAVITRS